MTGFAKLLFGFTKENLTLHPKPFISTLAHYHISTLTCFRIEEFQLVFRDVGRWWRVVAVALHVGVHQRLHETYGSHVMGLAVAFKGLFLAYGQLETYWLVLDALSAFSPGPAFA